ncbi:MAG: lipoprotein NlpI [Mariniblastus sp.]|jgi:lipoprotein NlpI
MVFLRAMILRCGVLLLVSAGLGCQFEDGVMASEKGQQGQDDKVEKARRAAKLAGEANESFSSGDYKTAMKEIAEASKINPDNLSLELLRGDIAFASANMTACVDAYDQVIRMSPRLEPQLWQRGLALYYASRYADGVKQFETHQTVNSQDVENAVWHLLCAAQVSDVEQARKKLIPIQGDTRVPMSQIYEMFAGRMTPADVLAGASKTSSTIAPDSSRQQLQRYYAHLYIGLYHEMLAQPVEAKAALLKAAEINPLGKTNFMGQVARVHLEVMKLRGESADKQQPRLEK